MLGSAIVAYLWFNTFFKSLQRKMGKSRAVLLQSSLAAWKDGGLGEAMNCKEV